MKTETIDLITGGTGFIGKHLAKRLAQMGRKIRILCRKGSETKLGKELSDYAEIVQGDLLDTESLKKATQGVSRVFHCAGHVSDWGTKKQFLMANVHGTKILLDAALEAKVQRFIHLSSIAAFGTPSPSYFDDESAYGSNSDWYSQTKAVGEQVVFDFYKKHNLPVTVIRPAVVYGPEGAWLEEPLHMIEKNKMFLVGGGTGSCHCCYIENLIDGVLLAADHPRAVGQAYIIADGDEITFRDYFNGLAFVAGKGPIRHSIPLTAARAMAAVCENGARLLRSRKRPLLTRTAINMVTTQSQMSIRKIRSELGFIPRYQFQSAMEELRNWYETSRSPKTGKTPKSIPRPSAYHSANNEH